MSNVSAKLDEIEALISSQSNASKSLAYSNLLHIQEQSTSDCSTVQKLAESSKRLISLIVADSSNEDEEIASKALKCLGFTMYHPDITMAIPVDVAGMVLETLSRVITTTKMKSVCNLGVWCISMQQFEESLLTAHFESLLKAAVHALDNPFGSLSTTFEAIQAVMKLSSQLSETMRNSSHTWAPPLYRRLLSNDKRERDMTGRCLSKIRPILLPPPLALSKVLASDMRQRLLTRMKEMMNEGMKIQALQAWGWFIRLLGIQAMENRSLVNNMLKVPEMTFSDIDTQVQISTQVAWEALIDALIQSPTSTMEFYDTHQTKRLLSSIRLIMNPLTGVVSSKCDLSVHSSCLNTWCYLLHKLDLSINDPSVKKLALEPIFKAVFRSGCSRTCMWNVCLDVLDRSDKKLNLEDSEKWLPCDFGQLDFYLHWIHTVLTELPLSALTSEDKASLRDDAVRIFRSVLAGMHDMQFNGVYFTFDDICYSLKKILGFAKKIANGDDETLRTTNLLIIRTIIEELDPLILGDDLDIYKVPLDLKFIKDPEPIFYGWVLEIRNITYSADVTPMVYLLILCFYDAVRANQETPDMDGIMKLVVASNKPWENLAVITDLFYRFAKFDSLRVWISAAKALDGCMDMLTSGFVQDLGCSILSHFLSYPFFRCRFFLHEQIASRGSSENVTAVWVPLYRAASNFHLQKWTARDFHDQLCTSLNRCLDDISSIVDRSGSRDSVLDLLGLYGEVLMVVSENRLVGSDGKNAGCDSISTFFRGTLKIAAKFIEPPEVNNGTDSSALLRVVSSVGSWLRCLRSRHGIVSSLEILSPALLRLLSDTEPNSPSIDDPLRLLWDETVSSLLRSQPPITFDSAFLEARADLISKALDHPNPYISARAVSFWKATYGDRPYGNRIDYPPGLVRVLDRLSRTGRITLLRTQSTTTAKHGRASKRVGLSEAAGASKRKWSELTEHQKEVRRAQLGKGRDSSPGFGLTLASTFRKGMRIHRNRSISNTWNGSPATSPGPASAMSARQYLVDDGKGSQIDLLQFKFEKCRARPE